jgi:hypothetical protein
MKQECGLHVLSNDQLTYYAVAAQRGQVYDGDKAITVWQIECDDHEITGFKAIRNPDKLGNV